MTMRPFMTICPFFAPLTKLDGMSIKQIMNSQTAPLPIDDPELSGFNVADVLEARAIRMESHRKRVRTRAKLLAVAARELEKVGYEALTVEAITSRAGIVRATFYLYFKSKCDIVSAVIRMYWALMYARLPRGRGRFSFAQSIHRSNAYMVNLSSENSNLFAAKNTLLRENDAIARRASSINDKWAISSCES
ncbi:TetR/AcrR family transcriptional regulator [Rhodobacteraceae bacterium D3-12]|nr:TetR/AcrR family transcriptional regulator [Rhodobacteraceae bacterium D3-12]